MNKLLLCLKPCNHENTAVAGHRGKGTRFWLACTFWVVIVIGELGWLSQSSMAIMVWIALYSLPLVYVKSQAALDALVEEACVALLTALQAGKQTTNLRQFLYCQYLQNKAMKALLR